MSEFPKLNVRLVDGSHRAIRMPPGYRLRRTSRGWQAWDEQGWRSPFIPLGTTADHDHAAAMVAGDHAWMNFMGGDLDPADDRPAPAVGEIVVRTTPPPDLGGQRRQRAAGEPLAAPQGARSNRHENGS